MFVSGRTVNRHLTLSLTTVISAVLACTAARATDQTCIQDHPKTKSYVLFFNCSDDIVITVETDLYQNKFWNYILVRAQTKDTADTIYANIFADFDPWADVYFAIKHVDYWFFGDGMPQQKPKPDQLIGLLAETTYHQTEKSMDRAVQFKINLAGTIYTVKYKEKKQETP